MACCFLACKLEESEKKVGAVVTVFRHVMEAKAAPLDTHSQEYFELKETVVTKEKLLLKTLAFNVYVQHPHTFVFTYFKALGLADRTEFVQRAWNYLNDSMRTASIVRFPPEVIAAACVYLTSRTTSLRLPHGWWKLCDASFEDLEEISLLILKLYEMPKAQYLSPHQLDELVAKRKEALKTLKQK